MHSLEQNLAATLAAIDRAQQAGKLSASAVENIQRWLTRPQYADYVPQILEHISANRWRELDDAFWTVIPFGTAGRRGRMYPFGSNAINDRTMGESAQGLADYVRGQMKNGEWGVGNERHLRCAIAYDTRHRSRQFAELCAEIMVANGFEVLFFDGFRPTPELSFTVRDKGCACGIMISASHNPPSDNAIKAFWSTGGQLRSPHDEGVIRCVEQATEIRRSPFAEALADGRVKFCQTEQDARYQAAVLGVSKTGGKSNGHLGDASKSADRASLKILYSPLHGVGLTSILPILRADGFENIEVYQPHAKPDGDFPNVPGNVANPENPAVFNAPIEHARTSGAELILASDPDADRIGCALPTGEVFTGNQIGALLAELLLRRLQQSGQLTPQHYVIKTLVTSDMICRIAEHFGCRHFGNLLTGFKWIGSKIDEVGPDKFVFGFEEAHGYLAGAYARDKDGAVAAMLLAELAAECKASGQTLPQHLDQMFVKYGCHLERSLSHTMPGADGLAKMQRVMERLRLNPPRQLGGLLVQKVCDYLRQEEISFDSPHAVPDAKHRVAAVSKTTIDDVPLSDLLIFELQPEGNRAAVRPSGTEPKLKFYLFAYETPKPASELAATKEQLAARLAALEADLISAASAES